MQNKCIWEILEKVKTINNIDDLIEYINNNPKGLNIHIQNKFDSSKDEPITFIEQIISKKNTNNNILCYTTEENPVSLFEIATSKYVYISKEFYKKNYEKIHETILNNTIKKINSDSYIVEINNLNYDKKLFQEIINNPKKTYYFDGIDLDNDTIQLLNDKHIKCYLNDKEISSNKGIGYINYYDLEKNDYLILDAFELTDEEINNFNALKDDVYITFNNKIHPKDMDEDEYIQHFRNIMNKINNVNKKMNITIRVNNREIFNKYFKDFELNKNIHLIIDNDFHDYSYDEYQNEENILDDLVKDIKNTDLTPLEKYIAVYNVVKNFKPYKEDMNNKENARLIHKFLYNDKMVCVGYALLLTTLCRKVGINCKKLDVSVDTSYDDNNIQEARATEWGYHARNLINLDDDKYDVHGIYVCDATWDNNLDEDYLNYAIKPIDSVNVSKRMFGLSNTLLILDVHNFKEYNDHINYILKKNIEYARKNQEKNPLIFGYKKTIDSIMNCFNNLDEKEPYEIFNKYQFKDNEEDYIDFITEIGNYLLTKTNKKVELNNVLKANYNGKKKILHLSVIKLIKLKEDLIQKSLNTSIRENVCFPYEIDENDHIVKK